MHDLIIHNYQVSFCSLSSHAWFKTDQLHCDTTQDCLGCCFDYPQSDNDYCHGCDNTNDIIVSCSKLLFLSLSLSHSLTPSTLLCIHHVAFDPTASQQLPVMEERSSVCRFHNKSLSHSSCSNPTQGSYICVVFYVCTIYIII